MASRAIEFDRRREYFWRNFPAMTDYFSPGIVPLLGILGVILITNTILGTKSECQSAGGRTI